MKSIVVDMYHERECKNSHRYDRIQADGAVNAVYLEKKDMDGPAPTKIRLTITELD